jgi:hypothetical protein
MRGIPKLPTRDVGARRLVARKQTRLGATLVFDFSGTILESAPRLRRTPVRDAACCRPNPTTASRGLFLEE